jgi:tripartite-type tricarboxylate transporter receptor subunit TctC
MHESVPETNHPLREANMQTLARCLTAMLLGLMLATLVHAQSWPSRPIRMIVNFGAGGSTDVIARSVAAPLAEALGQPVVVDNRVGAGGNIGLELAARAAPDGHTLLHSSDGPILINPHLFKLGVDIDKDLVPIAPTARAALFFVTHPGLPAKTLPEFLKHARANPGKLNYGSAGVGTLQHVAAEMLMRETKVQVTHVPYKGSQQVLVDLLSGRIEFTFDLGAAIPHIKSGKVRLLAVPTTARSPLFPETPTMIEQGVNVDIVWLSGIYAPAGTPRAIITRLNREIARIMQTPEARAVLAPMAAEVVKAMSPEEFAAHQARERARYGALVREAGIRIN